MKRTAFIVQHLCIAALILAAATPAVAVTRAVCPAGCLYTSIQSAIVAAATGDTVLVYPGTYAEQLNFLGKAITVKSNGGPGVTIVDAQKKNSVVRFVTGEDADSILQGFTLTNGQSVNGGGVYVAATSPVIRDCVITANMGTAGGGGARVMGTANATFEACRISGNESSTNGGGMYVDSSSLVLSNTEVSGNEAVQYGGGIYSYKGSLVLSDVSVSGNHAADQGGGIYAGTSTLAATSSVVSGNVTETYGGGFFSGSSNVALTDSHLENNQGLVSGGGAYVTGTSSVTTLLRSVVRNNTSAADGGGLLVSGGSLSLRESTVSGNSAVRDGGGLYIDPGGGASFVRTEMTGNTAVIGGAIYAYATVVTMDRCRLAGNFASSTGGAVGITNPGAWTVSNTQVDGNQSTGNGAGFWINGAAVRMKHVTLAGNRSFGRGGAVAIAAGSLTALSSIVWGNYASVGDSAFYPATPAVTYSDVQGGYSGTGNLNADPLFVGLLPVNNAPTAAGNYRLQATSPCIDLALAGGTAPPTDLDGDPRPQGPAPDMGADEKALLRNGAFDVVTTGSRPPSWIASKLTTADGVVANGYSAPFSMSIKGGTATKKLFQAVDLAGSAGDVIHLTFRHSASKPAPTGGYLGIQVKLTNSDGTSTVLRAPVPRTTHGWQAFSDTYLAPKSFTKVTVSLVSMAVTGRVWFDDVAVAVR